MKNSHPTIRLFAAIWGLLILLLALTVLVARYDLGAFSLPIALLIAVVKGALILLYFMNVRYGSREVWLFAGAAYLWVMILLVGTLQDYISRHWISSP
jgi:cytochrome c oxidase subunit 4